MEPHSKTCRLCQETKDITEFYNHRGRIGGSTYCKACSTIKRREHRKSKPHLVRKANLRANYDISTEDYERMRSRQNSRCLICEDIPERLFVDHSHITGAVRGLLCLHCNSALGYLKDNPENAKRAADYLLLSNTPFNRRLE